MQVSHFLLFILSPIKSGYKLQEGSIVTTAKHQNKMSVHKILDNKIVIADYFNEDGELVRNEYPLESLTLIAS